MSLDDGRTLRLEAIAFLRSVQELAGFEAQLRLLEIPPVASEWPWYAIVRVLSWPELPGQVVPPPDPGLLTRRQDPDGSGDEARQVPSGWIGRPEEKELAALAGYARAVRRFSKRFLAGPQWGPRVVHKALRTGEPVQLPHFHPVAVSVQATGSQAPVLRGDRTATWAGARQAVSARLAGVPLGQDQRKQMSRARRYLDAAVNGAIAAPGTVVMPNESTDDPAYEEAADALLKTRVEKRLEKLAPATAPPATPSR